MEKEAQIDTATQSHVKAHREKGRETKILTETE
jgi:hypothetical protein